MGDIRQHFYKGRVALNVLTNSIENAKAIYDVTEGHVLIGILSKNYPTVEAAVKDMKQYGAAINDAVSIGLGGGDNRQSKMVSEIAKHYKAAHINQVFPEVGITYANAIDQSPWINSLVSPTHENGMVNISTGIHSAAAASQANIPIESAIALIRDMGGQAIKFFPMAGLKHREAYMAVAEACGKYQFPLEPTGGIHLENFAEILEIALLANVPKIIPHVYSSIINPNTGATNIDDVARLYDTIKRLVDQYE